MGKRKKREDLGIAKPAMGLVGGSMILGAGGSMVSRARGPTGGVTTMASFMPAMGATIGAGLTLQQVRKLQKQTKRKQR